MSAICRTLTMTTSSTLGSSFSYMRQWNFSLMIVMCMSLVYKVENKRVYFPKVCVPSVRALCDSIFFATDAAADRKFAFAFGLPLMLWLTFYTFREFKNYLCPSALFIVTVHITKILIIAPFSIQFNSSKKVNFYQCLLKSSFVCVYRDDKEYFVRAFMNVSMVTPFLEST